jgi:hypothetical protein
MKISLEETYPIGCIIGDFRVIGHERKIVQKGDGFRTRLHLLCECNICGRQKLLRADNIKTKLSMTNHNNCNIFMTDQNGLSTGENARFYKIYNHMVERCTDPNNSQYKNYGGRGIECDYTKDKKGYLGFYNDLHDSYIEHVNQYGEKNTTIDRIDCNGNYTIDNLRWATIEQQNQNRRNMLSFIAIDPFNNIYMTNNQTKFANEFGLNHFKISSCLSGVRLHHMGWKFYRPDVLFQFDFSKINVIYKLY